MQNQYSIVDILYDPTTQTTPAILFEHVPEMIIWQQTETILSPELHDECVSVLLHAIGDAFDVIKDKEAARDVVHKILTCDFDIDSLIYYDAQRVVLRHARNWSNSDAKQFYGAFQTGYFATVEDGDSFIAAAALEGAVMLPLYRGDQQLLYKPIGLLLNDFPPIPGDPNDAALLPVLALKLMGRCYDFRPDTAELARKIEAYVGESNIAVDAEARFNLGLVYLYDAFRADSGVGLQQALNQAFTLFEGTAKAEAGRTDAALFAAITKCYLEALLMANVNALTVTVETVQKLLLERQLFTIGSPSPAGNEMEFYLVRLASYLNRWVSQLAGITDYPNIMPPMNILAETYTAVRHFQTTDAALRRAYQAAEALIMLPQIQSRFVQLQSATTKLQRVLADAEWRSQALAAEVAFYELVLHEITVSNHNPKGVAAADLQYEQLLAAAKKFDPAIAQRVEQLYDQGSPVSDILYLVLMEHLQTQDWNERQALGRNQEIIDTLIQQLYDLEVGFSHKIWSCLKHALAVIIHYAYRLYCADFSSETVFLYAEEIGGGGQEASEKDLEQDFCKAGRDNPFVKITRQTKGDVPGRVDLLMEYPADVLFPIEVKAESKDISRENIAAQYVAQARHYATTTAPIGFLFVLDTTKKQPGETGPHFKNYIYIDTSPATSVSSTPIPIIVVIFYANRYRPSDHSWGPRRSTAT